jgi:capsid protein
MTAAAMAVSKGWKTNTDIASDLGYDYADNLETIKREQDARAALGIVMDVQPVVANKSPASEKAADAAEDADV